MATKVMECGTATQHGAPHVREDPERRDPRTRQGPAREDAEKEKEKAEQVRGGLFR